MNLNIYLQQIKSGRTAYATCCFSKLHTGNCEDLKIKSKIIYYCLWAHISKEEHAASPVRQCYGLNTLKVSVYTFWLLRYSDFNTFMLNINSFIKENGKNILHQIKWLYELE